MEIVLTGLHNKIKNNFVEIATDCGIFCASLTIEELRSMLRKELDTIHEFRLWNLTKNEQLAGKTEPENGWVAVSTYSRKPNPDNDFVDLDALIDNAVSNIWYRELEAHNERINL